MNDDIVPASRRLARSGRVGYGETVVIHETSQTRIVFVPFFVHHSSHTELTSKIVTYRKRQPPFDWMLDEVKSRSLDSAATNALYRALRANLQVAEEENDGDYLIIRIGEGTANIADHEPAAVARALTTLLSSPEIAKHVAGSDLDRELTVALRTAIRLSEMRDAVAQLREYLESETNDESIYQAWCEAHSWCFGNAYVMRDDLRGISAHDHLDLLLPNVISGYRDIVELKRPNMQVLLWDSNHRNYYFSADVSKAVGQCHRYLDILHETAQRGLRDNPEIIAYHPRAIIVLGRSKGWTSKEFHALHGLNHRLSGVTVLTYDQLLAQGERLVDMLADNAGNTSVAHEPDDWDPDDLPF